MSFEVRPHEAADIEKGRQTDVGFDPNRRADVSKQRDPDSPVAERFDPNRRIDAPKSAEISEDNRGGFDPNSRVEPMETAVGNERPERGEGISLEPGQKAVFSNFDEFKGLQNGDKPNYSPDPKNWFDKGGVIQIEQNESGQIWTYRDCEGRTVPYIDGYPQFPPEAKHPDIGAINIGRFTDNRSEDKILYLQKLKEEYGLTEKPDGYVIHHDSENGILQLVKEDWHQEFSHEGGFSKYKEE